MFRIFVAAALVLVAASPVRAQDYPSRPIRLIIPYPPGAGTDLSARATAEYLSQALGQAVVPENKPGGGTAIGLDLVAKAKPDGYTLAFGTSDGISMLPAIKSNVPYKIPDDFAFAGIVAKTAPVVAVTTKLPIASYKELLEYAKANPGKLRYGTPGVASGPHLATALFAKAAGIEMVHIPFQGTAPAVTAAVGGFVDIVVAGRGTIKPFVDSGALRPIVTADVERVSQFPEMPTFKDVGLDISATLYFGVLAPAATPAAIMSRLSAALGAMNKDPKWRDRISAVGFEPAYADSTAYRDPMIKDLAQWKDVAKSANIAVSD